MTYSKRKKQFSCSEFKLALYNMFDSGNVEATRLDFDVILTAHDHANLLLQDQSIQITSALVKSPPGGRGGDCKNAEF